MTAPNIALADTDPAAYVAVVAALAINDEDRRWREQAALWRGVVERHGGPASPHQVAPRCATHRMRHLIEDCRDMLAVVAAAKAYAGGAS